MDYQLIKATNQNIDELINYKLSSILDYAKDINDEEKEKIVSYVHKNVPNQLESYQMINFSNEVIGCLLTTNYEDGVLLDEIYIKSEYQNKGIGTDIISNLMERNKNIYLWVYKDNINALNLYKKLSFKIIEETDSRYFMQYKGE